MVNTPGRRSNFFDGDPHPGPSLLFLPPVQDQFFLLQHVEQLLSDGLHLGTFLVGQVRFGLGEQVEHGGPW